MVVQSYESYIPTAFDESLTLVQKVNKVIEYLHQIGIRLNDLTDQWNEVVEWVLNDGLTEAVSDKLDEMVLDGTLAELINEKIFGELNERINRIKRMIDRTWIDPVEDFGAVGNNIVDDTKAIQDALDFSNNVEGLLKKRIPVNIGDGTYSITGVKMYRGTLLEGSGEFYVRGQGAVGVDMVDCLYAKIDNIKIRLTDIDQIGVHIRSSRLTGVTNAQLNVLRDVWIEGDYLLNTTGIKIGYTWTNNFYNCHVMRCGDGIEFEDVESNANIFYGGEVRHDNAHPHSKLAVFHRNGKNNAFIGTVLENYRSCTEVRNGDLHFQDCYTEAFSVDRPFRLFGDASLTITNCLLKGRFRISGGRLLSVTGCRMNRGGIVGTANSPLLVFDGDYNTKVVFKDNVLPESTNLVFARWGWWQNINNTTQWTKRSPANLNEHYLDRNGVVMGTLSDNLDNVTGDGTDFNIPWGSEYLISNPNNEFNAQTGIMTPINNGLYRMTCRVVVDRLDPNTHTSVTLFAKEGGGGARTFTLDSKDLTSTTTRISVSGSVVIDMQQGLNLRFSIRVNGGSKNVQLYKGVSDNSPLCYYSIERIA